MRVDKLEKVLQDVIDTLFYTCILLVGVWLYVNHRSTFYITVMGYITFEFLIPWTVSATGFIHKIKEKLTFF